MAYEKKIFELKRNSVDKLIAEVQSEWKKIDMETKFRMEAATTLVWGTARTKRKMTTNKRGQPVSDPNAPFGVPVAAKDGGALRASIKKEVIEKGEDIIGRIYIDHPGKSYAQWLEFGTSKMDMRPFMEPALRLNNEQITKIFSREMK